MGHHGRLLRDPGLLSWAGPSDLPLGALRPAAFVRVRARMQVRLLRGLNHPNVVAVECVFRDARHLYLQLPYLEGGSLRVWLDDSSGRLASAAVRRRVARGILYGLVYLHAQHIVHRDLKPGAHPCLRVAGQSPPACVRACDGCVSVCACGRVGVCTRAGARAGGQVCTRAGAGSPPPALASLAPTWRAPCNAVVHTHVCVRARAGVQRTS